MVIYSAEKLDTVFGALSNETRRQIVSRLSVKPHSVLELAKDFPISQPAVTKHLNVLEKSGIIERHREGRRQICVLNADNLRQLRNVSTLSANSSS